MSAQPKSTRRTLAGLLSQVALELAERAGMRLATALGIAVHRGTLLPLVLGLPDPVASAAPDMVGVDDFALRHGHVYATVLAGAAIGRAIDVPPGRCPRRGRPRRSPAAVQVADRCPPGRGLIVSRRFRSAWPSRSGFKCGPGPSRLRPRLRTATEHAHGTEQNGPPSRKSAASEPFRRWWRRQPSILWSLPTRDSRRPGQLGPGGTSRRGQVPWLVRLPSCSAAARRPACRLYPSGGPMLLGARRLQHPAPLPVLAASRGPRRGPALRGV